MQSNEQITRLDELQDIDELYVEEVIPVPKSLRTIGMCS